MKRIAFYLRKLADLFDAGVKPSVVGGMTIRIEADTAQCMEALDKLTARIAALDPQLETLARVGAVLKVDCQ